MLTRNMTEDDYEMLREVGRRIARVREGIAPTYSRRQLSFDLGYAKNHWVLEAEQGAIPGLSLVDIAHLARKLGVSPWHLVGFEPPLTLEEFEGVFQDREVASTLHSVATALRRSRGQLAGTSEPSESNINEGDG